MKNVTRSFGEIEDRIRRKILRRVRYPENSPDTFFPPVRLSPPDQRRSVYLSHTHTNARLAIRYVVNTIQNGGPAHVVGAPVVEFIYAVPAAPEVWKTKTIVLANTVRVRCHRLCSFSHSPFVSTVVELQTDRGILFYAHTSFP